MWTVNYLDSAEGDLNGDGIADAAVLLAINTGGTGRFVQLAAVTNEAGEPVQKATSFLGDRVQIKSVSILDGRIKITMITHGAQDPLCCPSLEAQVEYRLQDRGARGSKISLPRSYTIEFMPPLINLTDLTHRVIIL